MHVIVSVLSILVAIALFTSWIASRPRGHQLQALANIAEGFQPAQKTYLADAALATRYLLVKKGSDAAHVAVCGAGDLPLGIACDETAAAEENLRVDLLGLQTEGRIMIAAGVITQDTFVYTAANGQVQAEPTSAGTFYRVGRALTTGAADAPIEVLPLAPQKLVVIAALGSTNGAITLAAPAELTSVQEATANGSDAGTTQALANSLKLKYNALQADVAALRTSYAAAITELEKATDDVRALGAAAATPTLVKVLAAG